MFIWQETPDQPSSSGIHFLLFLNISFSLHFSFLFLDSVSSLTLPLFSFELPSFTFSFTRAKIFVIPPRRKDSTTLLWFSLFPTSSCGRLPYFFYFVINLKIKYSFSWGRKWQPIPVFLPGKFHEQRSLESYSPGVTSRTQLSTQAQKQILNFYFFLKLYGLAILKQPTMYCRIKQVSKHTDNNGSQASTLFPSIKKKA